jgi:hypothetical protein
LRKAGVIVHLSRVHEGTAGQMALDDQGVESCPRRIDRRGVAGRTRPDDDDVTNPAYALHQRVTLDRADCRQATRDPRLAGSTKRFARAEPLIASAMG